VKLHPLLKFSSGILVLQWWRINWKFVGWDVGMSTLTSLTQRLYNFSCNWYSTLARQKVGGRWLIWRFAIVLQYCWIQYSAFSTRRLSQSKRCFLLAWFQIVLGFIEMVQHGTSMYQATVGCNITATIFPPAWFSLYQHDSALFQVEWGFVGHSKKIRILRQLAVRRLPFTGKLPFPWYQYVLWYSRLSNFKLCS
jgi:hypothetical protein